MAVLFVFSASLASHVAKMHSFSHFIQKCFAKGEKERATSCREQCHLVAHSGLGEYYSKPKAMKQLAVLLGDFLPPFLLWAHRPCRHYQGHSYSMCRAKQSLHSHCPSVWSQCILTQSCTHTQTHTTHLLFSTVKQ